MGSIGSRSFGDIAIDDITLTNGVCVEKGMYNFLYNY
jgi:hypothetical protein